MPRAKNTVDSQKEHLVVQEPVENSTFIVPTEKGTEAQTMMAPIRRKNPPTIAIVLEAIKSLDDKKGSSYVAIKNWIVANYPEFNRNRLKFMITKALDKGVKESKIRRRARDEDNGMTLGRFKIAESKTTVKKDKPVKSAVDVPATSEEVSKKLPRKKSAKVTKSSKKSVLAESLSDTEAEAAKSPKVPAPRRRRSVSESAATAPPKVTRNTSKKNAAPTKSAEPKKTVAPKTTKAASSTTDATVKKTTTGSRKKTSTKAD